MGFILLRLFAAAAVLCAAALIKRRRVRKAGGFAIAGMVLGLLLFAVSFLPSLLFTDYEGIEPTGEYEVGQARAILVDKDRAEAFESDGSRREVPVYFYYPENGDATEEGFPLVVFSHGAFGYYQSNVSAYLELASHGYVVVSLDHPYHSFFTTDTQGKRITVDPGFMREVMGANQDNMSQEEIWELSRGWLELRTQDMDFVIDSVKDTAEEAGAAGEGRLSSAWFFESDEQERGIRTYELYGSSPVFSAAGFAPGYGKCGCQGMCRDNEQYYPALVNGKEFAIRLMTTYFTLVTLITAATLGMGQYFEPEASFGYEAFASPLIYGVCGTLPGIVMYSRKELSVKAFLIRKALQFVLIEITVLCAAFCDPNRELRTDILAGMGICVFVIFVLAHGIEWIEDCIAAKRLTEELLAFQRNIY